MKNKVATLNSIRLRTGSQCGFRSRSIILWSRLLTSQTIRASFFSMFCSLFGRVSVTSYSRELQLSRRVLTMLHPMAFSTSRESERRMWRSSICENNTSVLMWFSNDRFRSHANPSVVNFSHTSILHPATLMHPAKLVEDVYSVLSLSLSLSLSSLRSKPWIY